MNNQETINQAEHLTDEQLEDVLLGDAVPATNAHLAACAVCRARNDVFASTLREFNQASLAWSQARSNTLPLQPFSSSFRPATSRLFPPFGWAFVATLLVLVALFFAHPMPHARQTALEAPPPALPVTPDPQIAADNVLLAEIDSALEQPELTTVDLFGHPAAQSETQVQSTSVR